MAEVIIKLAVDGFKEEVASLKEVINNTQADLAGKEIGFPDTMYNLPLYFGLTGKKLNTISDLKSIFSEIEKKNYQGADLAAVLDLGINTLILEEFKMAIDNASGKEINFIPDNTLRSLGVQLVSGDICGIAVIAGAAHNETEALDIARSLQEKNILSLLVGNINGNSVAKQLLAQKVEMSLDTRIVPLGESIEAAVLAVNWAIRAALTYGGLEGGQREKILDYCAKRVPVFVLALGGVDAITVATAAGAMAFGFPVIANFEVPDIAVGDNFFLTKELDTVKLVDKCLDIRKIKVKITKVDIPVRYSSAFEGERVRKEDVANEFGGKYSRAVELVVAKPMDELERKKITVIGPDLDKIPEGEKPDFAIKVRVAGDKMVDVFASILERHLHHFINGAMGIMHIGQRNILWLRISKKAKESGFKLSHIGEIIYGKFLSNFGSIVDKVEVDIITDKEKVAAVFKEAAGVYQERDNRIVSMTDESVDEFYSCLLCQSFAPDHICIITPERLGLCGAYNWLDGKTAHRIDPTGPNQPVGKGKVIDLQLGQWEGINEFMNKTTHGQIQRFSAYSAIVDPMTSCGCFEVIVAVLPGTGGFMAVDRNYTGMTPSGMNFYSLAGVVGGGKQSPGFVGVGINYLISKKFLAADGGLKRMVWMPKALKEQLSAGLKKRAEEINEPDLIDKIADESITVDMEGLISFLSEKKHPALEMGELF